MNLIRKLLNNKFKIQETIRKQMKLNRYKDKWSKSKLADSIGVYVNNKIFS